MSKKKDNTIFAKNLKYLIEQKGINQKKVCEDLNIQQTTFCDYYNGKSYPRPLNLRKISDYFNVRVDELVYKDLTLNKKVFNCSSVNSSLYILKKSKNEDSVKTLRQIIILFAEKEELLITWSKKI